MLDQVFYNDSFEIHGPVPANCDSDVHVDEYWCESDGRGGREQGDSDDGRHDDGNRVDATAI